MCKDKQRGNYERGCFDIMSISLNRLLRFDAKVRVCVKKLRKKQYASWILLYFGHAARGRGKKNIIFEFLCFDLDLVLVPLRKQKMEKLKAVRKRALKWSEAEINALVTAVESQRRQILGSFSSDITSSTKTQARKLVTTKVSKYVRVKIVTSCRLLGYSYKVSAWQYYIIGNEQQQMPAASVKIILTGHTIKQLWFLTSHNDYNNKERTITNWYQKMNKDETKRRSVESDLRFGYILKLYSIIQINSVNITGFNRTREQVEHKWWDIKSSSKKAIALSKIKSVKTGGGRNTAPPPTELQSRVVSIIGMQSVMGIAGASGLETTESKDLLRFIQNKPPENFRCISVVCWLICNSVVVYKFSNVCNVTWQRVWFWWRWKIKQEWRDKY